MSLPPIIRRTLVLIFSLGFSSASFGQSLGSTASTSSSSPKTEQAASATPASVKSTKNGETASPSSTASAAAPSAVKIKGSIPLSEVNSQSTAPSGRANEQLKEIVVEGVPIEQTTLPVLPSSSLYGFDTTVQDTPRQVSQITPRQFQEDIINTYDDFARYAPGITQAGSRATPAAPTIRGGVAEIYQNGIQRFNPGIGFPFQANAYESADIVSGPASVIYGPTQNSAGYVDYTTKQPFFDANHTTLNFGFGTWASGGQGGYPNFNQQIDNGGPLIKDELAYRVSYQEQEANSYYEDVKNDYEDIYGALSWTPKFNKDFTADWNFEYAHYDYSQWNGASRITPDLINNNTYDGGYATPILKQGANYYSYDVNGPVNAAGGTWHSRSTPSKANGGNSSITGAATPSAATPLTLVGWVLDPSNVQQQKLYGYEGTINPADVALADDFNTELRLHFHVDDDFDIENHSFFEYQSNKINSRGSNYYYYNTDDFENRTEFIQKFHYDLLGLNVDHQSNTGVDLRFESLQYYNSQLVNGSSYNLLDPDSTQTLSQLYGGGTPIPAPTGKGTIVIGGVTYPIAVTPTVVTPGGGGNNYTYPGGAGSGTGTVDDDDVQIGLYTQHNLKLTDQWGFNLGGRATIIGASYTNPLSNSAPAGSFAGGDNTTQVIPAVSASLTYKPVDWTTLYLSYEYEQAVNTSTTGQFTPSAGTNQLGSSQFHSDSYIYEGGAKFTLIPNKLYGSISGYFQQREQAPNPALGVLAAAENVDGVDTSINYQPDKHLLIGANYSYIQAHYYAYVPSASAFDPYGFSPNGTTLFQVNPSGGAYPSLPLGSYRVSATPANNFNAFAQYQFDNGLGFRADLWAESDQNINVYTNLKIPAQYNVDLGVFYAQPHYRTEVDFLNVTDQRNWETDIREAASFLIEKPPFSVQGKFSYYF
jgi:outer membrane receptor protein involved in Fe transport